MGRERPDRSTELITWSEPRCSWSLSPPARALGRQGNPSINLFYRLRMRPDVDRLGHLYSASPRPRGRLRALARQQRLEVPGMAADLGEAQGGPNRWQVLNEHLVGWPAPRRSPGGPL